MVLATLRQVSGSGAELGGHGRILRDPVGKGVFAILDDATEGISTRYETSRYYKASNLRLAGLISIVSLASLARSDWSIVDKLKKMLAKASNDGELLTVLAESIELVGEG